MAEPLTEMKERAKFAGKNYDRLGSSWAKLYGQDIPILLDTIGALRWLVGEKDKELRDTGSDLCKLHDGDVANYGLTTLGAIERVNVALALTEADAPKE